MTDDNGEELVLWLEGQLRQRQTALEEQNAALLRDVATRLQRTGVIEVPAAPPPPPTIGNPFAVKQTPYLNLDLELRGDEHLDHIAEEPLRSETVAEMNLQNRIDATESHQTETVSPLKSEGSSRKYTSVHLRNLAGESLADDETRIQALVHSVRFELASGAVILFNLVVMAIEMQYQGFDLGRNIEYQGYSRSAHEEWIDLDNSFDALNVIFNLLFIFELLLRIAADQASAFKSPWIWFDSALIVFGVMELIGLSANINPRQLRVVRLVRLLRALKIVRVIRAFDSLHLLIKSIQASVGALVWSFVLLIFVQVACGMVMSQLLSTYISQGPIDEIHSRRLVFERFGTFTKAMLTMYEITFANWYPSCQLLTKNVNEAYALFFILYRCCFCFAVLKVITAVFIAETNRVVAMDDQIMIRKKQQDNDILFSKLRNLFQELDTNGDGLMSHEEFMQLMQDKLLKTWLVTLDINATELDHLFNLIDLDDSGTISIEEFVGELPRLKGPASGADIKILLKMLRKLEKKLGQA